MRFLAHYAALLIVAGPAVAQQSLPDSPRLIRTIDAAGKPGRAVVFADQGRLLATVTTAGVECWRLADGTKVHTWPGSIVAIAASADGKTLAALDARDDVHLLDPIDRKEVATFRFTGAALVPDDGNLDTAVLAFSPDGKKLAVGCRKDIEIWDLADRSFSQRFGPGWGQRLGAIDFLPDSSRVARTGFPTYAVAIWDTTAKRNVGTFRGTNYIRAGRLSPDGDTFAAGIDLAGSISIVQFLRENRRIDLSVRVSASVNSVAFSRDGGIVAVRSLDGKVRLIHRKSLQPLAAFDVAEIGKDARSAGLTFSPSGRELALDEGDRLRVWDIGDRRQQMDAFEKLTKERLESLWDELAGSFDVNDDWIDVPPVHQLVGVPEQAIPLLAAKLRPVASVDPTVMERLFAELDDDVFGVRERATKSLIEYGGLGRTFLADRLRAGVSLEQKLRIERILESTSRVTGRGKMREYRAIWIAWMIGTPAAIELIRVWAGGDPDAYLTLEARSAVLRLPKKGD